MIRRSRPSVSVIDSLALPWRLATMFYGERVVALTFVTNFIAVGLVFYSDIAFESSRATCAAMPGS